MRSSLLVPASPPTHCQNELLLGRYSSLILTSIPLLLIVHINPTRSSTTMIDKILTIFPSLKYYRPQYSHWHRALTIEALPLSSPPLRLGHPGTVSLIVSLHCHSVPGRIDWVAILDFVHQKSPRGEVLGR